MSFRKGLALFAIFLMAILALLWLRPESKEDKTFLALAKNIYYEAALAREPEAALHLPALVAINRASANLPHWGGSDLYSVIYKCGQVRKRPNSKPGKKVCQFSWVMKYGENNNIPTFDKNPKLAAWQQQQWEVSKRIARQHLDGTYVVPAGFEKATSYMNTEVVRKKWRHNVCAFKTTLIPVGKIDPDSKHDAYREPSESEKSSLLKRADVEECQPRKKKNRKKKTEAKG